MPPIFFVQTRRKRQKALSLLAFLIMALCFFFINRRQVSRHGPSKPHLTCNRAKIY